jgi:hypothetical protein
MAAALVVLAGATLLATRAALSSSPGSAPRATPSDGLAGLTTAAASLSPSWPGQATGSPGTGEPSPSPGPDTSPSPKPPPTPGGPFVMDLYRKGDFVSELSKVWCVAAAMQTSINIMAPGPADTTRSTQRRLFDLARRLAPAPDGAAEPEGWAKGLQKLGFGRFVVSVQPSIKTAVRVAAKALRTTNRPVGLMVWRGAHSWVMSGFKATADPALTEGYTVTAIRIEDVWWPRFSTIWGYSDPPDTLVQVSRLSRDFLPWKRPRGHYPDKDGRFVIILPVR